MTTVNIKVAYKCEDCGHVQLVNEHWVSDSIAYVGSAAHWCDSCGDGLPVRQPLHERNEAVRIAADEIWLSMRVLGKVEGMFIREVTNENS